MTKITRVSVATLFAIFAGSTLVSTVEAGPRLQHCNVTSNTSDFYRGGCSERELTRRTQRIKKVGTPQRRIVNFRASTPEELLNRPKGGGNGSSGGGTGGGTGGGNGGGAGGANGGRP